MTEVFLNKQRAILKEDSKLKLTIENTFFEDSGSYTLDVTFPLDIEENRKVFGSINRIEVTKRFVTFDATILVDSKMVFKGTAKITNINDKEVKLQMLSGRSHVKFWTKAEKMYIDRLHYEYTDRNNTLEGFVQYESFLGYPIVKAGSFPGKRGQFCYVPIKDVNGSKPGKDSYQGLWNEHKLMIYGDDLMVLSQGGTFPAGYTVQYYIEISRQCICPNLMFVAKWIFGHLGYTVRRNDRDNDFVNSIYIANATRTTTQPRNNSNNSADEDAMAKALPHWTVEEFIKQFQNFLNVKVIFDDIENAVDIVDSVYDEGSIDITNQIEDEYEVELFDDEDAKEMLYDSNLRYKKGALGGEYRLDMIDQEVLSPFTLLKFPSSSGVWSSFESMSVEERKKYVWQDNLNGRQYCANSEGNMASINAFGCLVRNENNQNDIELKISPVSITKEVKMPVFEFGGGGGAKYRGEKKTECKQTVLCLENQYEAASKPTVWDAITGETESEEKKEDIMQVFFMDGREHSTGFYASKTQYPFTDFVLQDGYYGISYSFSLIRNRAGSIGYYHKQAVKQNRNAEHRFKFRAKTIPSVYSIFLVRNKRYACKKMEVQFDNKGMDESIMGYFEEIF